MSDTWQVTAYYNAEANAIWRRRHPPKPTKGRFDRRRGPQEGDLAIEVQGPLSVVDMDRQAAEDRPDIGRVTMRRLERFRG